MKIKVIGCGSAFSKVNFNQSFLLEENGEKMIIDYGRLIPEALDYHGIDVNSIDYVYISHSHNDHTGGLEHFAFSRYDWANRPEHFKDSKRKVPKLICNVLLMKELWEKTLSGGLESMEGFVATLETYFEPLPLKSNEIFYWHGWKLELIQQIHIMTGSSVSNTFGLILSKEGHKTIYFTTDSQHCSPKQMEVFYEKSDIIFQDCEISPFPSGVHANYVQLNGELDANSVRLSETTKSKMWLSHYQDYVPECSIPLVVGSKYNLYNKIEGKSTQMDWFSKAIEDGFAGFLKLGQEFLL